MFINRATNTSYNFKAPQGAENAIVEVPFPAVEKQNEIAYAAAIAIVLMVQCTFIEVAELTGAATLNVTTDEQVEMGAEMVVKLTADGTNRVVTPGTGMAGAAFTVTANTTKYLYCKYDGTNWIVLN